MLGARMQFGGLDWVYEINRNRNEGLASGGIPSSRCWSFHKDTPRKIRARTEFLRTTGVSAIAVTALSVCG